jgi:hypothetical protein
MELSEHGANLHEIGAGEYTITAFLREYYNTESRRVTESTRTSSFRVVHANDALPDLNVRLVEGADNAKSTGMLEVKEWTVVADFANNQAELALSLVQRSSIPVTGVEFTTCLWVTSATTDTTVLAPTCLPTGQDTATLSGLSVGVYTLSTGLKADAAQETVIAQSVRHWPFRVLPLAEAYPVLSLAQSNAHLDEHGSGRMLEYGADGPAGTATIQLSVAVQGSSAATRQVVPCLTLYRVPRAPSTGVNTESEHDKNNDSMDVNQRSEVRVAMEVRKMTEFVPSYDWQALRPWHTIPSGLETRY